MVAGADLNGGVQQACGTDDLFDNHAFGTFQLKVGRGGADVDGLVHNLLEFFERQGAVVQGRRKPKAVIDQGHLARSVAAKHGADLGHGHVTLVHEQEEVLGEIIEQAKRPLAGFPAVEIPRVILDA